MKIIPAIFAVALAASTSAHAAEDARKATLQQMVDVMFDVYDDDHDDRLSFENWHEIKWVGYLTTYDADKDERISATEYSEIWCRNTTAKINRTETYDRCLTFITKRRFANGKAEFLKADMIDDAKESFRKNDLNRDGYISRAEMNRLGGL